MTEATFTVTHRATRCLRVGLLGAFAARPDSVAAEIASWEAAPPEAKEAEEELPERWERLSQDGPMWTRRVVMFSDLLALVPKLPDAQKQSLLDAVNPWAKNVRDGIRAERDAANALARSVQNNCDNFARELAEMTKRAVDALDAAPPEEAKQACVECGDDYAGSGYCIHRDHDAAPPEEAKRCLDGHLSETAHLCGHPKCPVHGASSPGQGKPDPTPHPAAAMANETIRRESGDPNGQDCPACGAWVYEDNQRERCSNSNCRRQFSPKDWARPLQHLPGTPNGDEVGALCGAASEMRLTFFAASTGKVTCPECRRLDDEAAPGGAETGTGHCARCGMFADELPHSEAFVHRHDFVPMTGAPQLRAALVAAKARIAELEAQAKDDDEPAFAAPDGEETGAIDEWTDERCDAVQRERNEESRLTWSDNEDALLVAVKTRNAALVVAHARIAGLEAEAADVAERQRALADELTGFIPGGTAVVIRFVTAKEPK